VLAVKGVGGRLAARLAARSEGPTRGGGFGASRRWPGLRCNPRCSHRTTGPGSWIGPAP
jgi:hypothetical protein